MTSVFQKCWEFLGVPKWGPTKVIDAHHANATSAKILRTPKDYGMEFEEVTFPATDGCKISAWYIPPKDKKSKKVALVSHQSW